MRFYEFIVEYKTNITRGNYGNKILDKLGIQKQINSGYGKGKNAVAYPQGVYQQTALMSMGISLNPYVDGRPVSPYSLLTQELYDENKNKILDDMLETFESFDPTPNKQYTQHIVKWYLSDNVHAFPNIEDGTSTLRQSLGDFNRMKERLPERYRDIAQYTSAKNFMDSVQYFKEEYGKKEELPAGQYKIIYNNPKYAKAYWAIDEDAACYLGQGTQWCTAATRSTNYFDEYDAKGPLLIFHMKKEIKYNLQDNYEDEGGHFHMEYADETSTFQVSLKVDSRGDWLFGDGDIAAPDDSEIDFADLYDYNSHFKAMYNTDEFQAAMTKVAKEWMKTTDHVAGAWEYPQYNQDEH
jgi:hypothetical protein